MLFGRKIFMLRHTLIFVWTILSVVTLLANENATDREQAKIENYYRSLMAIERAKQDCFEAYETPYATRCQINALKLAMEYPASELAHKVYGNIIEDDIDNHPYGEEKDLCEKVQLGSDQVRNLEYRKKLNDSQILNNKRERWCLGLKKQIAEIIFKSSECDFYTPVRIMKASLDSQDPSYDRWLIEERDISEPLEFSGFELMRPLDKQKVVRWIEEGKCAICRLGSLIAGKDECCVYLNGNESIGCVSVSFLSDNYIEYKNSIDSFFKIADKLAKNKNVSTYSYSESIDPFKKSACHAINIVRKNVRYVVRIVQTHLMVENKLVHAVSLDVLVGNVLSTSPKEMKRSDKKEVLNSIVTQKTLAIQGNDSAEFVALLDVFKTETLGLWVDSSLFEKIGKLKKGIVYLIFDGLWQDNRSIIEIDTPKKMCYVHNPDGRKSR